MTIHLSDSHTCSLLLGEIHTQRDRVRPRSVCSTVGKPSRLCFAEMVSPLTARIQRPRLGSSAANNPRLDYSRARTRSFPGPRPAEPTPWCLVSYEVVRR